MFQEIISKYTRMDAIQDGVLIDAPLNALAKEYGIKFHCAMTAGLFSKVNPTERESAMGQDLTGRLWDVLSVFRFTARGTQGDRFHFPVRIQRTPRKSENLWIKAICGPGDQGEPVITFMLPEED